MGISRAEVSIRVLQNRRERDIKAPWYSLSAARQRHNLTCSTAHRTYIVVCDRTAGFVTGGDWIDASAGACKLTSSCTTAVGKATFGFVSRYKPGARTPNGNPEFQFEVGGVTLKSSR